MLVSWMMVPTFLDGRHSGNVAAVRLAVRRKECRGRGKVSDMKGCDSAVPVNQSVGLPIRSVRFGEKPAYAHYTSVRIF